MTDRATAPAGYVLGHTARDPRSRAAKAAKIIAVLGKRRDLTTARVLEVGTGAGVIAQALAAEAATVHSVDIVDDRVVTAGYTQILVTDERLPFAAGSFDVVVSNQVLEHVGDPGLHLAEMRRVLTDEGFVYLATPNRWWPVEPHYRLPLLSWLPHAAARRYLRLVRKRTWDICPVSLRTLNRLARDAAFVVEDETIAVMLAPRAYDLTIPRPVSAALGVLPPAVRRGLLHAVPTHLKVLVPRR